MLTENLQIYKDTKELARLLLTYQAQVPKVVRYGEFARAVGLACEAMDMLYVANSDVHERLWALTRFLQIVGGIRSRVSLFVETRTLSARQGVNLMRHTCSYNLRRRIWRKLSATYKGKYICYNFKKIKERKL